MSLLLMRLRMSTEQSFLQQQIVDGLLLWKYIEVFVTS